MRGESATSRPQLPFGMSADSAMRSETPAIDAGRTDPAAWAAFAVPVDGATSRQTAAASLPPIEAPVGSPRFVDETAQQVTWLVKNGLSEAEIRVKPADMGPISVRIEMNQNEATISFAVTQPETRAAVQDSLHRLTEMLADSGISLGEANVGGQNFTQQPRDGGLSGRSRVTFVPGRGDDAIAGMPAGQRMIPERARGLVDTFA
jgi:flagellar hook-length control protein FliK